MGSGHGCVRLVRWDVQQLCCDRAGSVDHVVPVDIYLPGCAAPGECCCTRQELRKIRQMPLGINRERISPEVEAALARPTIEMRGLLRWAARRTKTPRAARTPPAEVVDDSPRHVRRLGRGDTSVYGRLVRQVVLPGSSRPYGGYFDDIVDRLAPGTAARSASNSRTPSRKSWSSAIDDTSAGIYCRGSQRLRDRPELRFELSWGERGAPTRTRQVGSCMPSTRCSPIITVASRFGSIWRLRRVHILPCSHDHPTNDWHGGNLRLLRDHLRRPSAGGWS